MKLTLTVLSLLVTFSAQASAPQQKTQAPGFYRTMIGDIEVTTLLDGFFPMKPKEIFAGKTAGAQINGYLAGSKQGDLIPTSVNSFLVNTGTQLVLVDTGCGAFFGPSFGHMIDNLRASGYTPDQVDVVVITHMHSDHVGGILKDGKAVFPNATLRFDQKDADFWLNPENEKNPNDQVKSMVSNAIVAVGPYKASNHFQTFSGKTEITAGVTAVPAYGHTPGHTAYVIESQGKKLMLVGDLFHVEAVQFADPSLSPAYDSDPKASAAVRKAVFKDAADQGFLIGAAHLPFPGIGHVVKSKSGGAYRYLPAPYAPVEVPAPAAAATDKK